MLKLQDKIKEMLKILQKRSEFQWLKFKTAGLQQQRWIF